MTFKRILLIYSQDNKRTETKQNMKNRTDSYQGTFENTVDGQTEYKKLMTDIRNYTPKGRFVKMYRDGKRNGGSFRKSGSTIREGSTRFDVYFLL